MTKDQYLLMCEQMDIDPDPEKTPLEYDDFPSVVQEAIQIFSILPARFEGMSGTYMGPDYTLLPYLFDELFQVDDKQFTMKLILTIGGIVSERFAQKQKQQQAKAKRAKGGTHIHG